MTGTDGSYVSAIGLATADCSTDTGIHSYTGGDTWATSSEPLSQSWYRASDGSLRAPGLVTVAAPCTVVRLAPVDTLTAGVVCSDGQVKSTSDQGATWVTSPAPVAGIDALTARNGGGYFAAIIDSDSCDGVTIATFDSALNQTNSACAATGTVQPGSTALSQASDGTLWLWAGDSVVRSADDGATW
jgi:hypothetical protein